MKRFWNAIACLLFFVGLIGCSSSEYPFVGGKVTGLTATLVLQNNGSEKLNVEKNGAFTFNDPILFYSDYNVTVSTQPKDQTCVMSQGSGSVKLADENSVVVTCYNDLLVFEPLTPTTLDVPANSSATVQYKITSQSNQPRTYAMNTVAGLSQVTGAGRCANPIVFSTDGESCILSVMISGSELTGNLSGGPTLCKQGRNTCSQPNSMDRLAITLVP